MIPMKKDTPLPPYMAFPRFLLGSDLSDTAKLVYVVLLDRGRLSQRNPKWQDEDGIVYVSYPIEKLAKTIHRSTATVKTALSALEKAGFISRTRQGVGRANHIAIYVPEQNCTASVFYVGGEVPSEETETFPSDGPFSDCHTAGNLATNNNHNQERPNNNERGRRFSYGEYRNVFLSDEDIRELAKTVPDYRRYIEELSRYMASSGKKYKNHAATIKLWAKRDSEKKHTTYDRSIYECDEEDSL